MKIRYLTAVAAAAALLVSGCSTAPSDGSDASGSSGGTTTISYAYWGDNSENATMKAMIAAFEKANPKIKIDASWVQSDYEEKLQTSIAGGKAPVVSEISNTSLASFTPTYQPVDLDAAAYYSSNIAASMEYQGKYYATPFIVKTKVMAINKSIFDRHHVPAPSLTKPMPIERFAGIAQKLTTGSGKERVYGSAPLWWQGWLTAEGGSFFSADGTKCTFASPAGVAAANLVIKAQADNGYAPSVLDANGQDMANWLTIGRIAMYPDFGPWNISDLNGLSTATDFQLVPDPGRGEPSEIDGLGISTTAGGDQLAAARAFVKFMSTDSTAQSLLTNKKSSMGVPVVESALADFKKAAPQLNLNAFVSAVDQSPMPSSVKQYAQTTGTAGTDLGSQTAVGSGKKDPAGVLPALQAGCQKTLDSNS